MSEAITIKVDPPMSEDRDTPNKTASTNFPYSNENPSQLTHSSSKPKIDLNRLDSEYHNPRKLKKHRSSMLKQAIPGYNEDGPQHKNPSVMKSKHTKGEHTVSHRDNVQEDTAMFSKTVFNPKTKFVDTVQGGFYKASKHHMSKSGTNFRKKNTFSQPALKMVFHESVYKLSNKEDLENGLSKTKAFDPETLNSPYRSYYPLSNKIHMTSTLYGMMRQKDKNFVIKPQINSDFNDVDLENELENNYVMNMLNISHDSDAIDQEDKKTVGDKAIHDFYKHYKDLNKVSDQNDNLKLNGSVYTGMLNQAAKKNILPNKVGIIKTDGTVKTLSVRNHLLGNKYMGVVAEGLKRLDYEKLDCKNNRLSGKGAKKVFNNLRLSSRALDLSQNNIGKSCHLLAPLLTNKDTKLQV